MARDGTSPTSPATLFRPSTNPPYHSGASSTVADGDLNVYDGKRQIFHVDAYRLTQPEAFDDLLIWDLAKSPWNVIVEWPEKVAARLPLARWQMKTAILADGGHRFQLTLAG